MLDAPTTRSKRIDASVGAAGTNERNRGWSTEMQAGANTSPKMRSASRPPMPSGVTVAPARARSSSGPRTRIDSVEGKDLGDRQLDALLERLDRIHSELRALNRRLDNGENLAPLVHQIGQLNDSLQALAYAALGQQGPSVKRRRAG